MSQIPEQDSTDVSEEEAVDAEGKVHNWFSRSSYAAAFGRYEGIGPAEAPDNAALLGRENQRARLLNLLFNVTNKGAYLVTGHRGSGKTTFVDYCLSEYRRSTFERFLKQNVGRTFLWDRVGLSFVCLMILIAGVLIHELLLFGLRAPLHSAIVWPILLVFGLLSFYPFAAAFSRIELLIERLKRKIHVGSEGPPPHLFPMIFSVLMTLLIALTFPLARPIYAASQLFLFFGSSFFLSNCVSLAYYKKDMKSRSDGQDFEYGMDNKSSIKESSPQQLKNLALVISAGALVYLGLIGWTHYLPVRNQVPVSLVVQVLAANTLYIIGLGCLLVATQQMHAVDYWETPKRSSKDEAELEKHAQLLDTVQSSQLWNRRSGFLLMLAGVLLLWLSVGSGQFDTASMRPLSLFTCLASLAAGVATIVLIRRDRQRALEQKNLKDKSERLVRQSADLYMAALGPLRRPPVLLGLKAILFTCLGLQVAYPLWAFLWKTSERFLLFPACADWFNQLDFLNEYFRDSLLLPLFSTTGKSTSAETFVELFSSLGEQLQWSLCALGLFAFIHYLEHEWIIRPNQMILREPALQHALNSKFEHPRILEEKVNRQYYIKLAEQTFFHSVYQCWLPVLVVPVNLGFDTLDHRRVIEAMLAGLRDAYRLAFLRWTNPFTIAIRIGSYALLVFVVGLASSHWFMIERTDQLRQIDRGRFCYEEVPASRSVFIIPAPPRLSSANPLGPTESQLSPSFWQNENPTFEEFDRARSVPSAMRLACHIGGESLAMFMQLPILPTEIGQASLYQRFGHSALPSSLEMLPIFFHELRLFDRGKLSAGVWSSGLGWIPREGHRPIWQLRSYHVLLFLFFTALGHLLLSRFPILPYDKTLRDLELLIESLSSRLREESRSGTSAFGRLVGLLMGEERVTHREADPFDPRSVELRTLAILRDIQSPAIRVPFLTKTRANLPIPEVIFKFDELDKLGIGVIPPHDTTGPESPSADILNKERIRSQALRQLFAELKNVVSSGAARFIFVGGRNLHDEWLADQTARRPLLTNIFEDELYLPSMIIDGDPWEESRTMWSGVQNYLRLQYLRAERLNMIAMLQRYRPWLTPWRKKLEDPIYRSPESEEGLLGNPMRLCGRNVHSSPVWWPSFQLDFIHFVTYRSQGNLKQIRTLLESFIQPTRAAMAKEAGQRLIYDCQHVLYFKDTDRFRIQLVADIFRQISGSFSPRMVYRDDKLVVGILYLSDFLLKFHRRAFAWNSLQKVDELVHIHRAPDLPKAVAELVHKLTEPFLHSIRNGMYDFRFNSDFAKEIEYLSRRSEEELAAFNFTLDESQALKAIYRSRIEAVKEPESFEFIAALGELHEFDEEYEVARYYYVQAVDLLDHQFHSQVSPKNATPTVYQVLSRPGKGHEAARRRLAWGVSRLRLKLQIGMSYEKSQDLEQAQAIYRNARTLAAALMRALLTPKKPKKKRPNYQSAPDESGPDYVSTLKHLKILFQPAFAEAWVSEKVVGGVDTSLRLLERRLWELRWQLPVVRGEFRWNLKEKERSGHANFALLMAEQHNKAGDLFFFKGKQFFKNDRGMTGNELRSRTLAISEAFLIRSHYHYALSMHEIRQFNTHRQRAKLNYAQWKEQTGPTGFSDGSWADFVYRTSAGTLADLGESFLSRVSLNGLVEQLLDNKGTTSASAASSPEDIRSLFRNVEANLHLVFESIRRWLSGVDDDVSPQSWKKLIKTVYPVLSQRLTNNSPGLTHLFGKPILFGSDPKILRSSEVKDMLAINPQNSSLQLLLDYTSMALTMGDLLARASYRQDAARKHLRVVETVGHLLSWMTGLELLKKVGREHQKDLNLSLSEDMKETLCAILSKNDAGKRITAVPLTVHEKRPKPPLVR